MTDEVLIDFEDLETPVVQKETIWDIENNEKMQILSFIEQQIMSKVQCILDEKDKKIAQLEQELAITNNLCATLYHRSNCLSNMSINLNPIQSHYSSQQYYPLYYKLNSQEIEITARGLGGDSILWEQIECFYNLTKLTLNGNSGGNRDDQLELLTEKVFKRIKSNSIKELIINTISYTDFIIHHILQNIPNLEILKLTRVSDITRLVNQLSSISHKLTKITIPSKFLYSYSGPCPLLPNMELMIEYCNKANIKLIILN
jgi:hypothetical protein